jgi:hypothetical protein
VIRLVLAQFAGYAALLAAVWFWLGIPERNAWDLMLSLLVAAAILAGFALLLARAFGAGWRRALVYAAGLAAALALGAWLAGSAGRYRSVVWAPIFAVLFAALARLPAGTWRPLRRWKYWAACVALPIVMIYLPLRLMLWTPQVEGFAAQTASMLLRFAIAFALSAGAWLAFALTVRKLARET